MYKQISIRKMDIKEIHCEDYKVLEKIFGKQ